MKNASFPTDDEVLDKIGHEFVAAYVEALVSAKERYRQFRQSSFFPALASQRLVANYIHDWLWAELVSRVESLSHVRVVDQEPIRQVYVDKYRIRLKRHDVDESISTYPTAGMRAFWTAGEPLPGLEEYALAFGYVWDAQAREIGDGIITLRATHDEVVWAKIIQPDTGAVGFRVTDPELPTLDLSAFLIEESADLA